MTRRSIPPTNGRAAEPMPTSLKAMDPQTFASECRRIRKEYREHAGHRAMDLLTNKVLSDLGYSEGVEIFEEAVRDWHRPHRPYPFRGAARLWCVLGFHNWAVIENDLPFVWFRERECRRCGVSGQPENPCP